MRVTVLNRGKNAVGRELPDDVIWRSGDVTDPSSLDAAIGDDEYDCVVNFLSYDADDAERFVNFFAGRTRQYIHISSASVYGKPVLQTPIVESSPTHNVFSPTPAQSFGPSTRSRTRLRHAIFRSPSCDRRTRTTTPILRSREIGPVVNRIASGREIPVHGDGTSLWTLTHADDFAVGLVGLINNPRAIGETFHITGGDVYTWGPDLHDHRSGCGRGGALGPRAL